MKKSTFRGALLAMLLIVGCSSSSQKKGKESPIKLQLLGQVEIPYNYSFEDTPVGGLSGLTYNPANRLYYVISDDRGDLAPARFYSFKLRLNAEGKLGDNSIRWQAMHALKNPNGKQYDTGTIDPEGIAAGPDSLIYISSEGDPRKDVSPFINAFSPDGRFVKSLPVPRAFWSAEKKDHMNFGVRNNLAFEGLSIAPNEEKLYAAIENALVQDGPEADSLHSSPSRMIEYDLMSGSVEHQYEYKVAPVHFKRANHKGFSVNGLSDVLALDNNGHLLSFDRNYVQGEGNQIFLYYISTEGATDINHVESLKDFDKKVQPVQKKLVANMSDYGITIDNFEGLVLGPKLKDGGRLLLMVSDNNFSSSQKTLFTAFSLQMK